MLLENQAVGHTTVSQTSACTKAIVSNYLLNSKVGLLRTFYLPCAGANGGFFCSCLSKIPSVHRIRVTSSVVLPVPVGPFGASEGKRAMWTNPRADFGCKKIIPSAPKANSCLLYRLFCSAIYTLIHPPLVHSLSRKSIPLLYLL